MSASEVRAPEGSDAWHLFETHAVSRTMGTGKVYKRWIFGRMGEGAGTRYDSVASGATLLLRNVVREYAIRELPRSYTESFEELSAGGDEFAPRGELLTSAPVVESDVQIQELDDLCEKHGQEAFEMATTRERAALIAKAAGISLDHPAVNRAAGCARTALGKTYRNYVQSVGEFLLAQYPGEDPEMLTLLGLKLLEKVKKFTFSWMEAEKAFPELSLLIETRQEGEV